MSEIIKPTEERQMPDLGCRNWLSRFYNQMPVCIIEALVIGINEDEKKQPILLPCQRGKQACVVEGISDDVSEVYGVKEETRQAKEARAERFLGHITAFNKKLSKD